MKWRLAVLLLLIAVAQGAQSVTLRSGDYTNAHLIAGAALALLVILTYAWWKLLTAVTGLLVKACVLLVVVVVGLQIAARTLG